MAGIDNRILIQLQAEDVGFVNGMKKAEQALSNLQRRLGNFAQTKGANPIKEIEQYTAGLRRTVSATAPEVQRLMAAISDARKINGASMAFRELSNIHRELASRYLASAKAGEAFIESQKGALTALDANRKRVAAAMQVQAVYLRQRAEIQAKIAALPTTRADGAPIAVERTKAYKALKRELDEVNAKYKQLIQNQNFVDAKRAVRDTSGTIVREITARQKEVNLAQQKAALNDQIARGTQKIATAHDTVNQVMGAEIARARTLNQLEQQRARALDPVITQKKIEAELAKQAQRKAIEAGIRDRQLAQARAAFDQAPFGQKLGVMLQTIGAAASRASTVFGALTLTLNMFKGSENAVAAATSGLTGKVGVLAVAFGKLGEHLTRNATQSMALNRAFTGIAVGAGLALGVLRMMIGIGRNLTGVLLKLTNVMLRVGMFAARAMYNGLKLIIGLAGRFVSSIGNMVKSLAGLAGSLLAAARARSQYNRDIGQAVDAEGWHSRSLKGLVGNVVNLNRWVNILGASVRQLGQAFQNAGMTLSVFLSYPSSRIFSGMIDMAMQFDKNLIEVRKNSDLLLDSLNPDEFTVAKLREQLVDYLQVTPTQPDVISKMAADTARLGLPPEFIAPYVQIMDQLVVATNITAESVVDDVGRIMNIFYDLSSEGMQDVETFITGVRGLGSAINELGQANPVGENEIIAAALRMAPAAATIGVDLASAIGLSASVAAAAASPERAGTQLNTAFIQMAKNLEDVAKAGNIAFSVLLDEANKNPEETFLAIVDAIRQIPGAMERATVANEFFGMIGGKAVSNLGASFGKVIENVSLARVAFEDGTSLALEFDRAMDAVSNQVGLLKNQFNVMGLALGDALLPVITQILTYVVPIMQAVAKIFKQLDDRVKLAIVGMGLFAAAIGPVLFAIGSLLFSLGIMTTGLTGLVTVIGGLIKIPLSLAAGIMALIAPIGLLKAAILGGVAYLLLFGNTFNDLGQMIVSFGQNMYTWGYNMFISFAEGIYSAASFVIQSVYDLLSAIAAMLRSFSPPKEGPLKDIDKWGQNIATTFADAFAQADLSGIVTFGEYIQATLESTIRGFDSIATQIFSDLWKDIKSIIELLENDVRGGLETFIKLLGILQSGSGDVDSVFAELGKYLGPFAQDMSEIIKLQIQYNIEAERANKLKEQMEEIDKKTQDTIREIAGDETLTTAERIARIRATKASAARERDILQSQLDGSEKLQDSLKELITYQQQVVSIFQEFIDRGSGAGKERIPAEAIDKPLKDKEEQGDDVNSELGELQENIDGVKEKLETARGSISETFAKITADAGRFVAQMNTARFQVAAFLDALLGRPINTEELERYGAAYQEAYDKGKAWRDGIIAWVDDLERRTEPVKQFFYWVRAILIAFASGYTGENIDAFTVDDNDARQTRSVLGDYLDTIVKLGEGFNTLLINTQSYFAYLASIFSGENDNPISAIVSAVIGFATEFNRAFGQDNPAVRNLETAFAPLKSIVDSLVILAGLVFNNLGVLGAFFGGLAESVVSMAGYIGVVLEFFKSLAGFSDPQNLQANLALTGNQWLKDLFSLDGVGGADFAQDLIDLLVSWIQGANFSSVGRVLGEKIQEALFGVKDLQTGTFSGGLFSDLTASIDPQAITGFLQNLIAMLAGAIQSLDPTPLITGAGMLLGAVFNGLNDPTQLKIIGAGLGMLLFQIIQSIPVEQFVAMAQSIINGLIHGLSVGISDKTLDQALKGFVSAFILGIAGINWGELIDTAKELAIKLIEALRDAPWGDLSVALSEFLTNLLLALTDPRLWNGLTSTVFQLATQLVLAIAGANWGALFTSERLVGLVEALVNGIVGGVQKAIDDRNESQIRQELQGASVEELKQKFEELRQLSIGNPEDFALIQDMATVRSLLIEAGEIDVSYLEDLEAAVARHDAVNQAFKEKTKTLGGNLEVLGTSLAKIPVTIQRDLSDSLERITQDNKTFTTQYEQTVSESRQAVGDLFDDIQALIEELLRMTSTPASAHDDTGSPVSPGAESSIYPLTPQGAQQQPTTQSSATATVDVAAAMQAVVDAITAWTTSNLSNLQALGVPISQNLLIGFALDIQSSLASAFQSILYNAEVWKLDNISNLQTFGKSVASYVRTGISDRFLEDTDYFEAISKSLSIFVGKITKSHSIYKDGKRIGKKIVDGIQEAIEDEWKDIAKSITNAVNRAIRSVNVSTTTGGDSGAAGVVNKAMFSPLIDDLVGAAALPALYEDWSAGNVATQSITVNITGDITVDNKDRVKELADVVSREIARRAKTGFAAR